MNPANWVLVARTVFSPDARNRAQTDRKNTQMPDANLSPQKKSLAYGETQVLKHMNFLNCSPTILDKLQNGENHIGILTVNA